MDHPTSCRLPLMVLHLGVALAAIFSSATGQSAHPRLLLSPSDVRLIRAEWNAYALFADAFRSAQATVDAALGRQMDVPVPQDAGGYTHERHKQNYREMQMAGVLFQVTGDEKYARFVRDMLRNYAGLYPSLGKHPMALGEGGGRLFWQSLNETVWLVHAVQAYDAVYDWLSAEDRLVIERGVLRPMAAFFVHECASTVDRIHNHATWMTAAIGMLGYVLDDRDLVDVALRGTKRDGTAGFLRQVDLLFSPDGYYSEGPYYARYAILPFFVFAEAIERNQPEIGIYRRRDGILGKALSSILACATPDGQLLRINDALEKTTRAQELVLALDYTFTRYGNLNGLLSVAQDQREVTLDAAGLSVAKALALHPPGPFAAQSVEMRDGPNGDEGGLAVLRSGRGADQSVLAMKYTGQGGGHGHFDRLGFLYYDRGRTVVQDYGSARFINIEQKFGGRYLPENNSWAKQTIAHNTLVVDGVSHYGGSVEKSGRNRSVRRFVSFGDSTCQVASAMSPGIAPGVSIERTMALVQAESHDGPIMLDILRVDSDKPHRYDLPLYYLGQFIRTNVLYAADDSVQRAMGKANGYQHLWREAEGKAKGPVIFTWLNGRRFYSIVSAADTATTVSFVRIGAGDPEFNLRNDPAMILRRTGTSVVFASVLTGHGDFEPDNERASGNQPPFDRVTVLFSSAEATVVEFGGDAGRRIVFGAAHENISPDLTHTVRTRDTTFTWTGPYFLTK